MPELRAVRAQEALFDLLAAAFPLRDPSGTHFALDCSPDTSCPLGVPVFCGDDSKVGRGISALPIHAGRRAEEMRELRATFRHHGLKAVMAPATQKILEEIAALDSGKASEKGGREGELLEALELFFQRGLLQERN